MLKSIVLSLLSIFAVFGFFCFILMCCKKTLKKPPVVICTYNDEEIIEAKLRIEMIKNPNTKIIVVDTGSSDETEKLVRTLMVDYSCISFIKR